MAIRDGNFNSSTIVALTSCGTRKMTADEKAEWKKDHPRSTKELIEDPNTLGEAALTYIQECNWERRIEGSLDNESNAKPLAWGKLCELYVQSKNEYVDLMEWEQRPDEPIAHPEFDYWTGTPDMTNTDTVGDIKAPFTPKSFCTLVQPIIDGMEGVEAMKALRFGYKDKKGFEHKKHPDGEKFFWQIVSNACITGKPYGELKIFCPFQSQLNEIRALAQQQDGAGGRFYGIAMSPDEELPHLPDGGFYKNWYSIRFPVPQSDKDALTARVKLAGALLEKREVKQIA